MSWSCLHPERILLQWVAGTYHPLPVTSHLCFILNKSSGRYLCPPWALPDHSRRSRPGSDLERVPCNLHTRNVEAWWGAADVFENILSALLSAPKGLPISMSHSSGPGLPGRGLAGIAVQRLTE
jgi:hypothetical protein